MPDSRPRALRQDFELGPGPRAAGCPAPVDAQPAASPTGALLVAGRALTPPDGPRQQPSARFGTWLSDGPLAPPAGPCQHAIRLCMPLPCARSDPWRLLRVRVRPVFGLQGTDYKDYFFSGFREPPLGYDLLSHSLRHCSSSWWHRSSSCTSLSWLVPTAQDRTLRCWTSSCPLVPDGRLWPGPFALLSAALWCGHRFRDYGHQDFDRGHNDRGLPRRVGRPPHVAA